MSRLDEIEAFASAIVRTVDTLALCALVRQLGEALVMASEPAFTDSASWRDHADRIGTALGAYREWTA